MIKFHLGTCQAISLTLLEVAGFVAPGHVVLKTRRINGRKLGQLSLHNIRKLIMLYISDV